MEARPMKAQLINDDQQLTGARRAGSQSEIPIYDDGFGDLYILRDSFGISGIVRARTWEDAYSICEDEFFPEADETVEELVREYGFKREHHKVIRATVSIPESERPAQLGAFEKFVELADYSDNGRLPVGLFLRWETIETPDPDAVFENELFQEAFGFRNNGPNSADKLNHGIYAKDLNGESLDLLTPDLVKQLDLVIDVTDCE
jgi:hypothetical protein